MVICLERDADLHMVQLMPLLLTVSCFSKIQTGFTFLVLAHLGNPGKRAVKRVWQRRQCSADLIFTLAQQLLLAVVVDPQVPADADEQSALERRDGRRDVVDLGPMNQLQLVASLCELVEHEVAASQAAWSQLEVLDGADDHVLVIAAGKLHQRYAVHSSTAWVTHTHTHTQTHTHPFNGPLSGTTRYEKGKTNLGFTEARDSEWQWHQLGSTTAQVTNMQKNFDKRPHRT